MAENMDINLQEMEEDELKSFIDNAGQQVEETQTQDPEPIAEDATQDAEETETEQEAEAEPDPEGQPEEAEIPDRYRGKTAAELVAIIEDGKKFNSRQANEIGQLRRELTSFRTSIDDKLKTFSPETRSEKKDFVDELINDHGYDEKDIKIITQLVEHKTKSILTEREKAKAEEKESARKMVGQKNQDTWDDIKDLFDNAEEIENKMIEAINADPLNTLYKSGWVKTFAKRYTEKQPAPTALNGNGAKKRISKATTVKSASRQSSGGISRSDLNSQDPETFRIAWNHFNPNDKI